MIRKISFSNFYSFKDEQVLDFTTQKKKSENYYLAFDGKQISKVIAFLGPNNSGKTNAIKVLGFLDYFLSTPNRWSDKNDVGFKSYEFGKKSPSSFYVEFETKDRLYFYSLETTTECVLSETLYAKKLEKSARKYQIFSRTKNAISLNKKVISGVTKQSLEKIRDDVSVIAFLKSGYKIEEISKVAEYFDGFSTNINEIGFINTPEDKISAVAKMYERFPELKSAVEEFIADFDLGIESFSIDKTNEKYKVTAVHRIGNQKYELPLLYESRGTKSLFVELLSIMAAIQEGTVLALDEIETGLHPQAVDKLIQFIVDSFASEKKQFIFASHSLNFMKKYDPTQMYLVEKNDNKSEVFRLDQMDIRPDENFYAKYMSGVYGAFPRIRV